MWHRPIRVLFKKAMRAYFPNFAWLLWGEPLVHFDPYQSIKEWHRLRRDPLKAASRRKSKEPNIEDNLFDLWRPAWFTKYVTPLILVWLAIGERDGLTIV